MKSQYFLYPAVAFSLAAIRGTADSLCPLQLRDNSSVTSVERTNDWTVVSWTSGTLWPAAKFYLALDGKLYGGNGQACSFTPNLKCATSDAATTTENFTITQDGLLSLYGQKNFWFCPDLDGDAHHTQAAPLVYPPKGFLAQNEEPNHESCNPILLNSDHCLSESHFSLDPQKIILGSSTNTQQETTSSTWRLTSGIKHAVVGAVATLLLS